MKIASTRISSPVVRPEPLADEVLGGRDLGVGEPDHAVRRALVHGAEDHEVGALLVGLDQLQLVAGDADVGVAGGQHLGDGRGVRAAVDELARDALRGEQAVGVGQVPRRPLDVGHPVERGAHRPRRTGVVPPVLPAALAAAVVAAAPPGSSSHRRRHRRRHRTPPAAVARGATAPPRSRADWPRNERRVGMTVSLSVVTGDGGRNGGQVQRRWTARSTAPAAANTVTDTTTMTMAAPNARGSSSCR